MAQPATLRLGDVLRADHVVVPLAAATVGEAVRALAARLVESGSVRDPAALQELFDERRIRDVIHVGERVLLPHLRTEAVDELVVALGIAPHPLPVSRGDTQATAQVIVLVLAPPVAADRYLQTVAGLARVLRRDEAVDALCRAHSPDEVLALDAIWDAAIPRRLTVRDVMTPRVYRVSPDTPVRELLELFVRHRLHAVPVIGEQREVLGMVTDRDVLRHLLTVVRRAGGGEGSAEPEEVQAAEARVREIMSRSVMCISEDQGLAEVAGIMANKDVERLPVVSEGRLTGFLTRGDIIRKFSSSY